MKECFSLKGSEFDACLDKWEPKVYFRNNLPFFRSLQILVTNDFVSGIIYIVFILLTFIITFYFMTLAIFISRFYSRLNKIESFILPVGFGFTAIGQVMKMWQLLF
jgi:hypothetical protein